MMIRLISTIAFLATIFSCSPNDSPEEPPEVVFHYDLDEKQEGQLGPRTRQWFIDTIEGVPLGKYDPQAAHEAPIGAFRMGDRKFYLYGMGVQQAGDRSKALWTSSFVLRFYKDISKAPMKNHKIDVQPLLNRLELDSSFESEPVQFELPKEYPIQDLSEALGNAKTEAEIEAVMEEFKKNPAIQIHIYPPETEEPNKTSQPTEGKPEAEIEK